MKSERAVILKGRAAIVTGAGSGIGRGIALALARAGARVAVVDVNEAGARGVVREAENEGGTAEVYKTDVTKKAEVDRMVASVSKRWGSVEDERLPRPDSSGADGAA